MAGRVRRTVLTVAEVRAVTGSEIVFEWDATDPEWVTVNGMPVPIGHLDTWLRERREVDRR